MRIANRVRKSIGAETSFAVDLKSRQHMLEELEQIAQIVQQRLEQHQAQGRTLTLKVKFSDYQQITRSKTMLDYTRELDVIFATAKVLFEAVELGDRHVRLLGISLSNLDTVKQTQIIQLPLFQSLNSNFS